MVTAERPNAWQATRQGSLTAGNLSMNLDNFRVEIGAEAVELTYLEAEVLRVLLQNADRVVPYRELATTLAYDGGPPKNRHLAVLVHRLRTKLPGLEPYAIETVRGRGYGLLRARLGRAVRTEASLGLQPALDTARRTSGKAEAG